MRQTTRLVLCAAITMCGLGFSAGGAQETEEEKKEPTPAEHAAEEPALRHNRGSHHRTGASRVIFNVPKAHSAGVELEFELATFDPELPAYDIFSLRLGLLKNRWDAAVSVNNLTDERAG